MRLAGGLAAVRTVVQSLHDHHFRLFHATPNSFAPPLPAPLHAATKANHYAAANYAAANHAAANKGAAANKRGANGGANVSSCWELSYIRTRRPPGETPYVWGGMAPDFLPPTRRELPGAAAATARAAARNANAASIKRRHHGSHAVK
jgi:hypothetical protein